MSGGFDIGNIGGANPLPADTGSELPPNPGFGIVAEIGFHNVLIADCNIHELGYWQNVKPSGNNAINGTGIAADGCNSCGAAFETIGLSISNCADHPKSGSRLK